MYEIGKSAEYFKIKKTESINLWRFVLYIFPICVLFLKTGLILLALVDMKKISDCMVINSTMVCKCLADDKIVQMGVRVRYPFDEMFERKAHSFDSNPLLNRNSMVGMLKKVAFSY